MNPAFEHYLCKIPSQLRYYQGARFTVILNNSKKPEGKDWASINGSNYGVDSPVLVGYLSQGHNYGVLAGIGGLVVLDIDNPERLEALGITEMLPETLTVRTGRGGLHFYLFCRDLIKKIVLEDPELKDLSGNPLHLGELQGLGQQVVGPNSTHPNGSQYEVIRDVPIAAISKDELLNILSPLHKICRPGKEQKKETKKQRKYSYAVGNSISIDSIAWPHGVIVRQGDEIRGVHPLHPSKSGNNFAINRAACSPGR